MGLGDVVAMPVQGIDIAGMDFKAELITVTSAGPGPVLLHGIF